MKTLVCTQPGNFEFTDTEEPAQQIDHAILRLKRVGVCGTDLHAFEGTQPYFNYPRILGHELSAEIVYIEKGLGFDIGDTVTIIPYFNCGKCNACRCGKTNCCSSLQVYGVHIDGGMREFISVPSKFLFQGKGLSPASLALVEPLAIGAHSVRRAAVQKTDTIVVVGAGPIGLGIIEFAKIAGAKVICIDVNEFRLNFSSERSRVDHVINGRDTNVGEQLMEITRGNMPDSIFDATGNLAAINNNFKYLSHGGKYILVGLQKEMISFSHPEFHKREGTLLSSRNATQNDFEYVIECLQNKVIDPTQFITHNVPFAQVKNEFSSWLKPGNKVIKAMITM